MTPKRTRSTIGGALNDAAEAIVKSLNKQPSTDVTPPVSLTTVHSTLLKPVESMGISPGKAADLRMKNLEQLRYLQSLYEDNIVTQDELVEQKRMILDALRKL